ncbi:hypothetical protein [Lactobacillus taiwanensis]|uniref:hypothetical protein n=1 Tax=Lactobacillus taiwanensis TaxID=508451 RepID=UPI00241F74E9|nr:hypothetical protein [Lactobacillus taiwanensis]
MKFKLKKLLHSEHPQHEILAFAMMGIGLILICNDFYFFWPPFAAGFLNDDLVGGLFIAIGIWLFSWAISDKNRIATNRNLLIATAGFLAFEATAEFCHGYVSGHPHMFTAGLLEVIVLLFDFSIIGKSKKHNY